MTSLERLVEPHDHAPPRAEPARQLGRRSLPDQPSARDDDHALAERLHLRKDVAREEDRAVPAQRPHQLANLHHLGRVEADGRLVEHEDRRVAAERLCEPDALPVALGERTDAAARHRREPAGREHGVHRLRPRRALHLLGARDEVQVLEHRQLGIRRRVLRKVADRAPAEPRLAHGIVSRNAHGPGGRRKDSGQHAERRGLPGAVGSEKAHDLAGRAMEWLLVH